MLTIGFIGAGNMAKAMMQGWQGNAEIRQVLFSPHSGEKVAAELGLEAKQSALDVWAESDMVVLAMPPAQLTDVAKELQLGLMMKPGVIVASVLGGVSLAQLHAALGPNVLIARTLPNVNVALKYGYTALAFDDTMDADIKGLSQLCSWTLVVQTNYLKSNLVLSVPWLVLVQRSLRRLLKR